MTIHEISQDQIDALCGSFLLCCDRIMAGKESMGATYLIAKDTWVVIDSASYPPRPAVCLLQHRPLTDRPFIRSFKHAIGFGGDLVQVKKSVGTPDSMRSIIGNLLDLADEFFRSPVSPEEHLHEPALPA